MLMRQFAYPCMLLTASLVSLPAQSAHAGPLIDWLFHKPAYGPAVPVGAPYPVTTGYAPTAAGYAPALPYTSGYVPYSTGYAPYTAGYAPYTSGYSNYSGYSPYGVAYPAYSTGYRATTGNSPTQSSYPLPAYGTYYGSNNAVVGAGGYGYLTQRPPNDVIAPAAAMMPSTTNNNAPVTLVPDYRSTYARTPVTYYRPVMTTDPNTGAQVVTLAPCTSYEYQTQRVPTWGLTQVYNGGASLPAVTPSAPITSPTMSLPRGGVPLAGPVPSVTPYATAYGTYPSMATSTITPVAPTTSSVITPASPGAVSSPAPYTSGYSNYASNYGNYSALQPGAVLPPTGSYPTTPYSPYYGNGVPSTGSTGGGSTGSTGGGMSGTYVAPPTTYGNAPYGTTTSPSVMPPSVTSPAPSFAPGYPSMPGQTMPGQFAPTNNNNPVMPPSSDPAAGAVPSLAPLNSNSRIDNKPQLQNIVQQPLPGTTRSFNPSSSAPTPSTKSFDSQSTSDASQGLLPIPIPEDFKREPRWNPGLLKEQDPTAATWGSKPIQWASHKSSMPEAKLRDIRP